MAIRNDAYGTVRGQQCFDPRPQCGVAELLSVNELTIFPWADMQRIAGGQGVHPLLDRGERRVASETVARVVTRGTDKKVSRSNLAEPDKPAGGNRHK